MLGADIFVIHGSKSVTKFTLEEYCKRFTHLIEMGKNYGVRVCHENVVHHRCESPEYMKMMKDLIGPDFKIVLDTKQALRAGYTPYDFIDLLHDDIVHVHISDFNEKADCVTPFKGNFDFLNFFTSMSKYGYKGKYIIELYNWSYENKDEIVEAYKKLADLTRNIC